MHFGATDIDHPLFFVWFCCNIAHMFVPDFRGSCVINGPMDLNRTLSFSLFFFIPTFSSPPPFFFFVGRDRGRVYSRGEYAIPRKGFEFLSVKLYSIRRCALSVLFGNACYTLRKVLLSNALIIPARTRAYVREKRIEFSIIDEPKSVLFRRQ